VVGTVARSIQTSGCCALRRLPIITGDVGHSLWVDCSLANGTDPLLDSRRASSALDSRRDLLRRMLVPVWILDNRVSSSTSF
jgi:hypothetical protein